ncbi:MAG: TraR/DksA family transcriptional regulator [Aquabacterium sp.]
MGAQQAHAVPQTEAGLNAEDLARLRQRLQSQVRALAAQDSDLRARLASGDSATANTFVAGVEGAMAAEADEEVLALMRHEQVELKACSEALKRIDRGDYGCCEECGDAIGLQRLEVVPDARYCVSCQDMAEHRHAR